MKNGLVVDRQFQIRKQLMDAIRKQLMDAILCSANPKMVTVDNAIKHLSDHEELYWEVGFRSDRDKFYYPMYGFIEGVYVDQLRYHGSDGLPRRVLRLHRETKDSERTRQRITAIRSLISVRWRSL
jgi:hypothetical protein